MLAKQSNSQSAAGFLIRQVEVNIVTLLGLAISYLGIKKMLAVLTLILKTFYNRLLFT